MKKKTALLTAMILALGISVCNAQNNGMAAEAAGTNCKDGVCEFVPGAAGGERTAFAAINPYNNAVPDIEGRWERDVKQLGPHDIFVAGQSDPMAGVVFSTNNPIKNFKVLSLHFKDFSNGKPVFLVQDLYTKEVFLPDRPLLVKFSFFGSIPNNGISYMDSNGKTRYYAVSESGKDGSLLFVEF
jgi:hypothetical protein